MSIASILLAITTLMTSFSDSMLMNSPIDSALAFSNTLSQDLNQTSDPGQGSGLSAMFCGAIGQQIIVAGGCNFPADPLSAKPNKVFYDAVYFITKSNDSLTVKPVGTLPIAVAYGSSVTVGDTLICIGGQSATLSYADCFALSIHASGQLVVKTLPSLPKPLDNAYATRLGRVVFVAGGTSDGEASADVYRLDLDALDKGWALETRLPGGPRVQPVLVGVGNALYVWGGNCPAVPASATTICMTGLKYDCASKTWSKVPVPAYDGESIFLGGACGCQIGDYLIACVGGVNRDIFSNAIKGLYPSPEYIMHPKEWYRFNPYLCLFDTLSEKWMISQSFENLARAGAGMVPFGTGFVLIQGEEKPRIRSSRISIFAQSGN